ncbi:YeeE/YedE family protein [Clostridium sp. LIBA-8841]|uniref:YeeE/YedE family protein n=1 Tax=Clostridium sp. LIBA-8841 TaxID=2987530 RepID=UPI002AC75138|nr:YeeE/YedE family protein [Clostridium sp. LIBA-8841]MDZ5254095.1 YeeE/YedE family protein [Clostridium sp. LIBA-8841]
MKKYTEYIIGFVLLAAILMIGKINLGSPMLFFRLLAGLGLGYALTRSLFGFAGGVNRSYRAGSTKLMRKLMILFVGTAIVSVCFFIGQDPTQYDLWVNPINLGLILGGIIFGFGMAFSSCCASGVLTDVVTGLPRALITLIFFGMGVYVGFPLQSIDWIKNSLISTETFANGVFLPDLFKWDGLEGYLGAIIVTIVFAGIAIWVAKIYEEKRKAQNTYLGVDTEILQEKIHEDKEPFKLFSHNTYEKLFVRPWTLGMGAVVIGGIFTLLMGVTKAGWGASTPYGFWFGRLLVAFGVSPESVASFAGKPIEMFTAPFFSNGMNVQNIGIILGTLVALLLAGSFTATFKAGLSISGKEALIYIVGGFAMGFGTRLSNGCNVGALYTPIANLSLSGWIFFVFLVVGGILGNIVYKKLLMNKSCNYNYQESK